MKAKSIKSNRQLARTLGRDEKAVRLYLADERWPFRRKAPWPAAEVPAMKRWQATALEQQDDSGIDSEPGLADLSLERKAKLRLVVERAAKLKLERELLAGRYLLRDEVESDLVRRATEAKQTLSMVTGLAPRLVGRTEAEIRRLLIDHVALACNAIAEGKSA